jgi:hypothetical protein
MNQLIQYSLHVRMLTRLRYTDHMYLVLTLQKLVHIHPNREDDDNDSDSDDGSSVGGKSEKRGWFSKAMSKLFSESKAQDNEKLDSSTKAKNGFVTGHTNGENTPLQKLRTLQRYHGGPNMERMAFMEAQSPLTKKKLAVSAEQVSIFLTAGMFH